MRNSLTGNNRTSVNVCILSALLQTQGRRIAKTQFKRNQCAAKNVNSSIERASFNTHLLSVNQKIKRKVTT